MSETQLFQLSSTTIDNYQICINGHCDEGTALQVLTKWEPYMHLFKNGMHDFIAIVSHYDKNYAAFDFRFYYKVNQSDDLKVLTGHFIAYVDDEQKLTAFHDFMDAEIYDEFLKTIDAATSKKEL